MNQPVIHGTIAFVASRMRQGSQHIERNETVIAQTSTGVYRIVRGHRTYVARVITPEMSVASLEFAECVMVSTTIPRWFTEVVLTRVR